MSVLNTLPVGATRPDGWVTQGAASLCSASRLLPPSAPVRPPQRGVAPIFNMLFGSIIKKVKFGNSLAMLAFPHFTHHFYNNKI